MCLQHLQFSPAPPTSPPIGLSHRSALFPLRLALAAPPLLRRLGGLELGAFELGAFELGQLLGLRQSEKALGGRAQQI